MAPPPVARVQVPRRLVISGRVQRGGSMGGECQGGRHTQPRHSRCQSRAEATKDGDPWHWARGAGVLPPKPLQEAQAQLLPWVEESKWKALCPRVLQFLPFHSEAQLL